MAASHGIAHKMVETDAARKMERAAPEMFRALEVALKGLEGFERRDVAARVVREALAAARPSMKIE